MVEKFEKSKEPILRPMPKKYLITWSLRLGREELEKISRRPKVLRKGLEYMKNMAKRNALEIYRIAPMEEVTHFAPPRGSVLESANPHGIAIAEAASIEEVRSMVNHWVEGFGFGGISVQNYLEYDIQPLIEVVNGR